MSLETREEILASARKIIADANEIKQESRRHDFVVEAATIGFALLPNDRRGSLGLGRRTVTTGERA